jgi:hypothetical protein
LLKKHEINNIIAAGVLLSRLEEVLTVREEMERDFGFHSYYINLTPALEKWCLFLGSLLHHRLTKIHLPCSFCWNDKTIVQFVQLLDEIGAKCSGLQLIEHKVNHFDSIVPDFKKDKDFRLKEAFFRALPKLVNLQVVRLYFFLCDDWALEQFGEHGTNIV